MMPLSASDKIFVERIERRAADMDPELRDAAVAMAKAICEICPSEMERSSALAHLEEVLLWVKAGQGEPAT
jgi:hypothetical protein